MLTAFPLSQQPLRIKSASGFCRKEGSEVSFLADEDFR
jgi:hypothetical protein